MITKRSVRRYTEQMLMHYSEVLRSQVTCLEKLQAAKQMTELLALVVDWR